MATSTIARRLLAALRDYLTKRRHYAELRDYDPRLLRDIGLRRERGRLVPLNPEREPAPFPARPTPHNKAAEPSPSAVCPRCGSKLA
ncbi:DUF1127 domain-containing protein [Halomonas sp. M4R5S39]|uniref:DUF1127 domain-containing protein n=1 Tax=Halomonas kalidii TaxID=3043293 RepID=UPI0024A8DAA6|nr:DUF1127 domain-containing protein [Halomonas kalidii]MDI5986892.1 DUF1127 domain-containing protein [Halomonas kalidii]